MEDHHVDRPDVEAWQHVKLTGTNSSKYLIFWRVEKKFVEFSYNFIYINISGGYSGRPPPDPIPNSVVKLPSADGTSS